MRLKFWKDRCATCKNGYTTNYDDICQACKDSGWKLTCNDLGNRIYENNRTGYSIYIPSPLLSSQRL